MRIGLPGAAARRCLIPRAPEEQRLTQQFSQQGHSLLCAEVHMGHNDAVYLVLAEDFCHTLGFRREDQKAFFVQKVYIDNLCAQLSCNLPDTRLDSRLSLMGKMQFKISRVATGRRKANHKFLIFHSVILRGRQWGPSIFAK